MARGKLKLAALMRRPTHWPVLEAVAPTGTLNRSRRPRRFSAFGRAFSCAIVCPANPVWGIERLVRPGQYFSCPPAECRAASDGYFTERRLRSARLSATVG